MSKTWRHKDPDWLVPELRNITDKLTMLRNTISENNHDDIGYMEDNEPNMDWGLVNDWINDVFLHEIQPARGTLELANKLWRKYN
jgi:hypothetical protein|tara:strand:+ start:733 stop:987 length:255 start_codon:yes stop_codon:yes gene_type:complete